VPIIVYQALWFWTHTAMLADTHDGFQTYRQIQNQRLIYDFPADDTHNTR